MNEWMRGGCRICLVRQQQAWSWKPFQGDHSQDADSPQQSTLCAIQMLLLYCIVNSPTFLTAAALLRMLSQCTSGRIPPLILAAIQRGFEAEVLSYHRLQYQILSHLYPSQSCCYWFYQRHPFLQLIVVYHPTFFIAFNLVYHKTVVLSTLYTPFN